MKGSCEATRASQCAEPGSTSSEPLKARADRVIDKLVPHARDSATVGRALEESGVLQEKGSRRCRHAAACFHRGPGSRTASSRAETTVVVTPTLVVTVTLRGTNCSSPRANPPQPTGSRPRRGTVIVARLRVAPVGKQFPPSPPSSSAHLDLWGNPRSPLPPQRLLRPGVADEASFDRYCCRIATASTRSSGEEHAPPNGPSPA